jgi:hypothetical protein
MHKTTICFLDDCKQKEKSSVNVTPSFRGSYIVGGGKTLIINKIQSR